MSKNMIAAGLAVFVIAVWFPFWFKMVSTTEAMPEPVLSEKAKAGKVCVLDKYDMRANHMSLLDEWRDAVVRDANRQYTAVNGHSFNMSLSTGDNSCLGCHDNKEQFCDTCHTYASVRPYCWECHITPKEIER